jgi:hypothetical protein
MDRFRACPQCACYVKTEDPACPFCASASGARPIAPARREPAPARARARMGRSQWLAIGSVLSLGGCSGQTTVQAEGPPPSVSDEAGGPIVACTSRTGYFECDTDSYCDRSIQACDTTYSARCESYEVTAQGTSCWPCPTCACLNLPAECSCTEDSEGALTYGCPHACYGAPPPRRERRA